MNTTTPALRPFHTPVRGFVFAHRPPGGAPLERSPLTLRHEPGNPADPYAVAVWADGGGRPWRVGYLERAVAARLAGRLGDDDRPVAVRFAGWWSEPEGRWQRPVVRVESVEDVDGRPDRGGSLPGAPRLWGTPPCSRVVTRVA